MMRRRQVTIVFWLVAYAFRLDDVKRRAQRVAKRLGIAPKDLCDCALDVWGKRYHAQVRNAWRTRRTGIRTRVS